MAIDVAAQRVNRDGNLPGLDGIRALAIGFVLVSHSIIYHDGPRSVGLEAGFTGVYVFFVLSGYLITSLLLREEGRTGAISLRLFYMRRGFRLLPALWLYLLTIAAISVAGGLPDHPWHSLVTSMLYVRNLVGRGHETDHLWTLSIEGQFYLLWPLAFIVARRHHARLALSVAAIVAITAWRVTATRMGLASYGALHIRSDFRFDAPLFGCALAMMVHLYPGAFRSANATARRRALLSTLTVGALALWVWLRFARLMYPGIDATVPCLLGMMLVLSQLGASETDSWLAWRPLVALGQISYGVYLWQQLFLGPPAPGFAFVRTVPVGLAATLVVAGLSFWCLEKPLLQLKDRRFHRTANPRSGP